MRLQVLISTMNQKDYSLLDEMNIHSDAIVINQCQNNSFEEFDYMNNTIRWFSFSERGIGLSRNTALMRASAEICLFADDDIVYYDDYVFKVKKAFRDHPQADVIIFNVRESRNGEPLKDYVTQNRIVGRKGVTSFATFTIGVRTERIKEKNIYFHRMFGGGTEYSCGEDTIFLQDCVNKGLKIFTCTSTIGIVYHKESTWFRGYTDKYFIDKGVLYQYLYPRLSKCLAIYHVLKHRDIYSEVGVKKAVSLMWKGIEKHI